MGNTSNKYHYFYKITNNLNGHFYYGVHNTNNLDDGYMGSGTRLHYAYKKYGIENFTKEILKFFDTSKDAFEYEAEVVNEDLIKDDNCYNIKQGGEGWQTIGLITVKDKDGNCFNVQKDDPRFLSGELVGISKDLVSVKDKHGNNYKVSINDPRYVSGELVSNMKNFIHVVDKNGKHYQVSKNDNRYISGELIPFGKNKVLTKDKNGNVYYVNINDERYISGELSFYWQGKNHTDETKEKIKKYCKDNNFNKGEKNPQYGTCWINRDGNSIRVKKEELDKYLSDGWLKGRRYNNEQLKNVQNKLKEKNVKPSLNTIWIYNDNLKKSIYVKKEELDKYLSEGWLKGRKMKF